MADAKKAAWGTSKSASAGADSVTRRTLISMSGEAQQLWIELIINGLNPEGIGALWSGGRVTGLSKPGKPANEVRLIVVSSYIVRMAAKHLLVNRKAAIATALGAHQMAVGVSKGAETLLMQQTLHMERHPHGATFTADFKGAFPSLDRDIDLDNCIKALPCFFSNRDVKLFRP